MDVDEKFNDVTVVQAVQEPPPSVDLEPVCVWQKRPERIGGDSELGVKANHELRLEV